MADISFLKAHRTWEDYVGIVLGVLIGLTPNIAGETSSQAVTFNAAAVGILVLVLASFELVYLQRTEEVGEFLCGAWLFASPFLFGYAEAGQLRWWHFSLGAVVAILALFEFWQDWRLSDEDLAKQRR
jgi:SPW repeat-containing protein